MDLSNQPVQPAPRKVLFVTPECAPLTKTGGLGDVSAALPAALRELGTDVRVLLPAYSDVLDSANEPARVVAAARTIGFDWKLLETSLPSGVPLYLLACPGLYQRSGGPYQAADGRDWEDNGLRFGLLCRVAADLGGEASPLGWRPDILHCNDWPTGLTPAFPHAAATLMTVHNLAFQGNFDAALVAALGLPAQMYALEGLEFYGRMSFLKAGLGFADAVTTVSPSYANEIQTEEFGCGMHGIMQRRRGVLEGILNGIDTAVWNPATDAYLPFRYDRDSLDLKKRNKAALQARMGLDPNPDVPLIGMVGRFTHQKGIDLAAAAAARSMPF
jgi:starch synthase